MQYLEEMPDGTREPRTEFDYMVAKASPDYLQVMALEMILIWKMKPRKK